MDLGVEIGVCHYVPQRIEEGVRMDGILCDARIVLQVGVFVGVELPLLSTPL